MDRGSAVRDWMSRKPAAVQADSPIGAAVALMHGAEIRHLLVMEGDRLTGILSSRDLGRLVGDVSPGAPVRAGEPHHDRGPRDRRAEAPVTTAARVLLEMRIGSLPVRDGTRSSGSSPSPTCCESLLWFAQGAAGRPELAPFLDPSSVAVTGLPRSCQAVAAARRPARAGAQRRPGPRSPLDSAARLVAPDRLAPAPARASPIERPIRRAFHLGGGARATGCTAGGATASGRLPGLLEARDCVRTKRTLAASDHVAEDWSGSPRSRLREVAERLRAPSHWGDPVGVELPARTVVPHASGRHPVFPSADPADPAPASIPGRPPGVRIAQTASAGGDLNPRGERLDD